MADGAGGATRKLVVVVGAGVAGCQAARALLRAGYDVLILEQGRGLGGVWRRNYHSFGLQVPWTCYTFPEFPYDKAPRELAERAEREGYPSGETVKDYIAAYCAHFDLERHIVYGAKVVHLGTLPGHRWTVRFRHAASPGQSPQHGALKTMVADLVVMATGMYYSPYVPSVPGLASFKGTVLHARDFASLDRLAGKRVLVLGAGKSATDCAVAAASPAARAASVTSLFRQAHWPLPRRLFFGVPFHRVMYTRFMAGMLPMYYTGQGRASKRLKHGLLSPLKRLFWSSLEGHVARKMRLRGILKPELDFVQDLFFGGQIQDGVWNEAVNAGRISAVQGSLAEVRPGGVRLTDGTSLDCDVLIFATGYTKDYSLFDAATAGRLMAAAGSPGAEAGLHLYRSVLSPWVPNLYFIGCEASSFNNVLTSGLQSLWMVHHLLGGLQMPSAQEMMKDIQNQRAWRRSVMPAHHLCASSIMLYQQRYHDQLVGDMGASCQRKRAARRGGSECFGVYTSEDYSELFGDDAVPGLAAAAATAPPPRAADAVVAAAVTLMPAAAAIGARLDLVVMPAGGGGGGGGGADAAAPRAMLVPVCTEHSDGVAIAMAPGDDVAAVAAASAAAASGLSSAFVSSFDSPLTKRPAARGGGADPPPAAAADAARVVLTAKGSRQQLVERTLVSHALEELRDGGGVAGGGGGGGGGIAAVLDTATNTDGGRSSGQGPVGVVAASNASNALPSVAGGAADGDGGGSVAGGGALSRLSTNRALAASSVTGSAAATVATSGSRTMTLAHRVRLQVLHLVHRSAGGSSPRPPGGGVAAGSNGSGAVAGAAGEEVLELQMASSTTMTNRAMEDSLMGTGQGQQYGGVVGGGGVGGGASGTLCCDNMRHAAPNVYNELVGTLEVH